MISQAKGIVTMSHTIAQMVVTALVAQQEKTTSNDDDKANSDDESGTSKANLGYTKALTHKK